MYKVFVVMCKLFLIYFLYGASYAAAVDVVKADFTRPCKTSRLRLFIAKLPNRTGVQHLAARHVNCIVFTGVNTPIFTRRLFYPFSNLHAYCIRGDVALLFTNAFDSNPLNALNWQPVRCTATSRRTSVTAVHSRRYSQ